MKKLIIVACFILGLMIPSCQKVDLSQGNGIKIVTDSANVFSQRINKVLINNQPSCEFTYNDSKLVIKEQSKYTVAVHTYDKNQLTGTALYGNDNLLSSDTSIYNAAIKNPSWITLETGTIDGYLSYAYDNKGQLFETKFAPSQESDSLEYSKYTYDANHKIIKEDLYQNSDKVGYVDYAYDDSGNLISETLYNQSSTKDGQPELLTKTEYKFDDKRNPFRTLHALPIPGINTNMNNIVEETYTIHRLPADTVIVTKNTYTYQNGYPATKNGGVSFVYQK